MKLAITYAVLDEKVTALKVGGSASTTLTLSPTAVGSDNFVSDSEGNAANITLESNASVVLSGAGEAKDVTGTGTVTFAANGVTQNFGTINLTKAEVTGGTVKATGAVTASDTLKITGGTLDNTGAAEGSQTITAKNATVEGGVIYTGTLTLGKDRTDVSTLTSSIVDVKEMKVDSGSVTVDGGTMITAETFTGAAGVVVNVGTYGDDSSTGSLHADTLHLNGAKLVIDPDFTQETAVVTTQELHESLIDGDVVIGQNSAFGVSFDSKEDLLAQLTEDGLRNGIALREDVGAVAYFNTPVTIAAGCGLYLDPNETNPNGVTVDDNKITMNEGAAIVLTEGAFGGRDNGDLNGDTAITFGVTGGTTGTVVNNNGKILLSGSFYADDELKIFGNAGAAVPGVTVESLNGVLSGTVGSDGKVTNLEVKEDVLNSKLTAVSTPMKGLLVDVLEGGNDVDKTAVGASFLSEVATSSTNGGKDAEAAARMAVFGGAVQAALLAQQTSSDAVADRLGMASVNSSLVAADNAQGGALWLAPVYRNMDSDEFDAQGVDYGADIDLAGVALGADFTTDSGVRVGGYFNVGSGDADGQGVGSDVSNDFDYFGLGIYAGMTFGDLSVIADAGFTQVSNDLEQNTAIAGKLTADTDTDVVSVGVKGEYKFATDFVDVVPHVGVRYTRLDMDSYDVKGAEGVYASSSSDSMSVFSIPFGVSLSKDIAAGDWTVKPVFDLTLAANTGDDEFDSDVTFTGVDASTALSTEVLDDFTYGASLGVSAKYADSLSVGVNVGYTGSDNTDSFGVAGTLRYMF